MHLLLPSILTDRMNNDRANVHVGDNLITTRKRVRKQAVSNSTVVDLLKIATELDYNHLFITQTKQGHSTLELNFTIE